MLSTYNIKPKYAQVNQIIFTISLASDSNLCNDNKMVRHPNASIHLHNFTLISNLFEFVIFYICD